MTKRSFLVLGEGLVMLSKSMSFGYCVLGKERHEMVERAISKMIVDLQYERHQARKHGCNVENYDKEIEQYKQLKQVISL